MGKEHKGLFGLLGLLAKPSAPQKDDASKKQAGKSEITPVERYNDQPYLPKVGKSHRIVGLNYRKANVLKLATENPDYKLDKAGIIKQGLADATIHRYVFTNAPVELVQEPDNSEDPNAIKVIVGGQHIGYIKAGSCAHLNKVISEGRIEQILCRISGGPYKGVFQDEDEAMDAGFSGNPTYRFSSGTDDLRAEIRVVELPSK